MVRDLDERRGQGEATGVSGGDAGDERLGGGNDALVMGDDLIRQSGDRRRDPPQGQELPERASEPMPPLLCPLFRMAEQDLQSPA